MTCLCLVRMACRKVFGAVFASNEPRQQTSDDDDVDGDQEISPTFRPETAAVSALRTRKRPSNTCMNCVQSLTIDWMDQSECTSVDNEFRCINHLTVGTEGKKVRVGLYT